MNWLRNSQDTCAGFLLSVTLEDFIRLITSKIHAATGAVSYSYMLEAKEPTPFSEKPMTEEECLTFKRDIVHVRPLDLKSVKSMLLPQLTRRTQGSFPIIREKCFENAVETASCWSAENYGEPKYLVDFGSNMYGVFVLNDFVMQIVFDGSKYSPRLGAIVCHRPFANPVFKYKRKWW